MVITMTLFGLVVLTGLLGFTILVSSYVVLLVCVVIVCFCFDLFGFVLIVCFANWLLTWVVGFVLFGFCWVLLCLISIVIVAAINLVVLFKFSVVCLLNFVFRLDLWFCLCFAVVEWFVCFDVMCVYVWVCCIAIVCLLLT